MRGPRVLGFGSLWGFRISGSGWLRDQGFCGKVSPYVAQSISLLPLQSPSHNPFPKKLSSSSRLEYDWSPSRARNVDLSKAAGRT